MPSKKSDDDDSIESYDLEDGFEDNEDAPSVPIPRAPLAPVSPRPSAASKSKIAQPEQIPQVGEVWTRAAEWGQTLALLGAIGAGVLVSVYLLVFWGDKWGTAFLLLFTGIAVMGVLSYPIMITLERPVRITPEQAAKDYFGALSHALPHYKRMWLLLSTPAREAPEFGSFAAFRSYWKQRQSQLKVASGKGSLVFDVADFKSEKSAGKSFIDGKFTVVVRPSAYPSGDPVETMRLNIGFAKGPDNMWYLNSGTLPGRI